MYRTIIVPLDGSLLSERALPLAAALAHATGARLVLLQAVRVVGAPGPALSELQTRVGQDAQHYLDSQALSLRQEGLTVATTTPSEAPDQAILTTADLHEADLIVMTTHGRAGLGRLIHGSVAEAVLQHSPIPVLLVHAAEGHKSPPSFGSLDRIVIPLDGSPFAERALLPGVALARALGAKVSLLRVVPAAQNKVNERRVDLASAAPPEGEAATYLAQVADRLRGHGVIVETIVRFGPPAEAIVKECQANQKGLLAMATHGRTGMDRIRLGSVAMQVLTRGKLPTLLVRPVRVDAGQKVTLKLG